MRSGSSAATSGSLLVRRNTRIPLSARSAASPLAGELGDERRPGADEAGVGEVEDRPQVAEAVLDRRAGEGEPGAGRDAAQLLAGLVGRVLDGLRLVEDDPVPRQLGQRVDVAHRGAVGGDDDVGAGHLGWPARRPTHATRRGGRRLADSGVNRAASAAQLPTTAGGAITSAGPVPGGAGEVGEHGRRLAEAHVEREAAAELDRVEEARASPAPRPGSCAARRRSPSGSSTGSVGTAVALSSRSVAQPLPSTSEPLAERRSLEADGVAQDLGAGELGRRRPLGQRRRRLLQVDRGRARPSGPRDRTSGRASAASRATSAAVSSTSSNTADHRTLLSWWAPTTVSPAGSTNRRRPGCRLAPRQRRAPAPRSRPPRATRRSRSSAPTPRRCSGTPGRAAARPARSSTGRRRSSRASSSATGRVALRRRPSATSTCDERPLRSRVRAPTGTTRRCGSGGSSCTTSRGRDEPVTGLAHRSSRSATSAPAAGRRGEGRAVEPGDERLGRRRPRCAPSGGGAGSSSMRRRPARRPRARPRRGRRGDGAGVDRRRRHDRTGPGMVAASRSSAASSTSAGLPPHGHVGGPARARLVAVQRRHHGAAARPGARRDSERGRASARWRRRRRRPSPPPTATSQPSARRPGSTPPRHRAPSAAARPRGCSSRGPARRGPRAGRPARRCPPGRRRGPPAHTTT